jgi:hypothetical protein
VGQSQLPACQLYGSHNPNNSQFFKLEVAGQLLSLLGPVYNGSGLQAADIDPITGQIYTVKSFDNSQASELYTVDPSTGSLTLVGPIRSLLNQAFQGVEALSFRPDGSLWGFARTGPAIRRGIIQINPMTGRAILIRPGSQGVDGMAWSPDGNTLWLTVDKTLLRYLPSNGSLTSIRSFNSLPGNINGLDTRPDGLLVTGVASGGNLTIYSLNPNDGQITALNSYPAPSLNSIETLIWPSACGANNLETPPPPGKSSIFYLPIIRKGQ